MSFSRAVKLGQLAYWKLSQKQLGNSANVILFPKISVKEAEQINLAFINIHLKCLETT